MTFGDMDSMELPVTALIIRLVSMMPDNFFEVKHYIPLIPIANMLDSIPTSIPTNNTCLNLYTIPACTRCCKNKYICLL